MKTVWLLAAAAAFVTFAPSSFAQTDAKDAKDRGYFEVKQTDGSSVVFKDDPMSALGMEAGGATLVMRGRPARALLIRPRLQFLSELLKSAEAL
jgi:hypothetical protein